MKLIEKFSSLDKFAKLSVIAIIIGIMLRFAIVFFVYPSGDSTWHLSAARFIAENNKIPLFEPLGRLVFWAPPVFHITAAMFYKIFSVFGNEMALKSMDFATFLFGSLSLIVFYLFSSSLMQKKTAFYSTLFFTFIPINIYYSTISHVESTISFFALLSLYLLVKKRFYLAAVSSGIGCLSKYSMFWMFPTLLFVLYKQNADKISAASVFAFIKKSALFFFVTFIIGIPWYVRNTIHLGNPVYHFLNGLFVKLGLHPYMSEAIINIPDYNIFKIDYAVKAYLDLFGVPLGLPSNLFSLKLPLMPWPVIAWLAVTAIFFIPIVAGLFSAKKNFLWGIILLWIGSFAAMMITYIIPEQQIFLRLFLPALPAVAIVWGIGFEKVLSFKHINRMAILLIIGCILVFSAGEIAKAKIAGMQYANYETDFNWVKENTANTNFYPYSIVLVYYLDRPVVKNYTQAQYYFESPLSSKRDPIPEEVLNATFTRIYNNPETDVSVYEKITT